MLRSEHRVVFAEIESTVYRETHSRFDTDTIHKLQNSKKEQKAMNIVYQYSHDTVLGEMKNNKVHPRPPIIRLYIGAMSLPLKPVFMSLQSNYDACSALIDGKLVIAYFGNNGDYKLIH